MFVAVDPKAITVAQLILGLHIDDQAIPSRYTFGLLPDLHGVILHNPVQILKDQPGEITAGGTPAIDHQQLAVRPDAGYNGIGAYDFTRLSAQCKQTLIYVAVTVAMQNLEGFNLVFMPVNKGSGIGL